MKAICTNGLVIECGNFKAIDGGVILTEDVKRKRPIGFVPTGTLRYVLPDEVADSEDAGDAAAEASDAAASAADATSDEIHERSRSGETNVPSPAQRRTVARLRDRLDRVEATMELSRADDTPVSSPSTDDPTSDRAPTDGTDADADTLRVTGGDGSNDSEITDSTADDAEGESGIENEPEGTARSDGREGDASADDTDAAYPDLQRVDGLGPTYAGRLHDEGIETLSDLEAADPEDVAAIADVGTSRAADWITQAGELA